MSVMSIIMIIPVIISLKQPLLFYLLIIPSSALIPFFAKHAFM